MNFGRNSSLLAALMAAAASIPEKAPTSEQKRRDEIGRRITSLVRRQKPYTAKAGSRPIDKTLLARAEAKRQRRRERNLLSVHEASSE